MEQLSHNQPGHALIGLVGLTPSRRAATRVDPRAASGVTYLLLGALTPLTSAVVFGSDPRLVATAAGLALLGVFAGATAAALRDQGTRLAAVVVLLLDRPRTRPEHAAARRT